MYSLATEAETSNVVKEVLIRLNNPYKAVVWNDGSSDLFHIVTAQISVSEPLFLSFSFPFLSVFLSPYI